MNTETLAPCVLCGQCPTELMAPPRRTFDRGADPEDNSFSITVILPDVALCDQHSRYVRDGDLPLGWCDDPLCRTYGEAGERSACGAQYATLATGKGRSTAKTKKL